MHIARNRALIISYASAVILAIAVPDLRYGYVSFFVVFLLTPLATAIPLAVASFSQGKALRPSLAFALALLALLIHAVISVAIYALWVGRWHFDDMTYTMITLESMVQFAILAIVFTLALGASFFRRRGRIGAL